MKNIFLLSTDKPSRLGYLTKKGKETYKDLRLFDKPTPNILDSENQNIFITSDEKIKEGDWFYVKTSNIYGGNVVVKSLGFGENCWSDNILTETTDEKGYHKSHCVKIILTTDPKLIKDGVQAIDDEFLEWFVKNSSCEEVKIIKVCSTGRKCDGKGKNCNVAELKIIIPQQEPKLTNNCPKCGLDLIEREGSKPYCTDIDCGGIILSNETLREFAARKQESVEAAARKLLYEKYPYHHPKYGGYFMDMFIEGAKWAEERTNK